MMMMIMVMVMIVIVMMIVVILFGNEKLYLDRENLDRAYFTSDEEKGKRSSTRRCLSQIQHGLMLIFFMLNFSFVWLDYNMDYTT